MAKGAHLQLNQWRHILVNDVLLIVIAALASYRLSMLIALEDGPFDVLFTIRQKLGAYRRHQDGSVNPTHIGKLLSCPYCIGIWVALVLALVLFPITAVTGLYWFAIAGCQVFLESLSGER